MNKLREIRQRNRLTLEEMARRTGLTLTGYRQIEIDAVVPKLTNAMVIAAALGVTVEDIWTLGPSQPA